MAAGSNRATADSQGFPPKSALIPYLIRRIVHGAAIYRRMIQNAVRDQAAPDGA
jgi:hypothetical protein